MYINQGDGFRASTHPTVVFSGNTMPTLTWVGKDKVVNHHHDVPFRVLNKQYTFTANHHSSSNTTQNRIIQGDNLEALKSLLPEFEGKVKCIYIDPPYNTGNEGWVYNDNVNDPKIKKWLGQVVGKEGEDLSRHDKWLCMMYPRLKLLHKLLADDGVIFVSIDDNEQANLKLIMDEIFSGGNFIANIAVVNNFKGRSDDKYIASAHESLLIFTKGNFITNGVPVPDEYQDEYKEEDSKGKYRLQGLRKRGSNARQVDRPNLFYPIYYNFELNTISLEKLENSYEILPKLSSGENGTWRWGKETFLSRIAEIEIRVVKTRNEFDVFQKDYLSNNGVNKRIKPKSFWHGSEFSSEAGTLQLKKIFKDKSFPTPKSVDLIEFCLQQATDKNSIILDSFAGSGTTAHAVLKLNAQDDGNRRFILIEMMDYAENITAERVRRVINGYGQDNKTVKGLGGGFDYYTIGQPLFLDNDNLNEVVGINTIRDYISYSEGIPTAQQTTPNNPYNPYVLGLNREVAWVFFYEQERITTLDIDFLGTLQFGKNKPNSLIVYADKCLLSPEFMRKYNIRFKKIPRDITRF